MRINIFIQVFLFFSCVKSTNPAITDLNGSWELKAVKNTQTGQVYGAPPDLHRPYMLTIQGVSSNYSFATNSEFYVFSGTLTKGNGGIISFDIQEQSMGPQRNIPYEPYSGFISNTTSYHINYDTLILKSSIDAKEYYYLEK